MAASTAKIKLTQLPIFIVAKHLPTGEDGEIYGLELKRAMEDVIGKRAEIECIQKVNGLWRLIVWEKRHRELLLQYGLNVRGFTVTLHSRNPYLGKNGEEQVRLIISNVPYSIASEEIVKSLDLIGLTVSAKDIQWEQYRDENRNMLKTKTGRRVVFIDPPITPLPTQMKVAGVSTAYLNYKGMQKKTKQLGFRARHGSESQSDESEDEKDSTHAVTANNEQAAALPSKTIVFNHVQTDPIKELADSASLASQKGELVAGTSMDDTATVNKSMIKVSQPTTLNDCEETLSSKTTLSSLFDSNLIETFSHTQSSFLKEYPIFSSGSSRGRSSEKKDTSETARSRSESLKRPSDKAIKPRPKKAKRKLTSSSKAMKNRLSLAAALDIDEDGPTPDFENNKVRLNCCLKYDWYEMMWVYT